METYEHQFAKAVGVAPAVVKELRRTLLAPDEWRLEQGRGVLLSEEGEKKLRAALPGLALTPQEGAGDGGGAEDGPAAPAAVDYRIRRVFLNPRIVEGVGPDGRMVNIRVRDSRDMGLQPGMVLPGCTPRKDSPVWNFTGRVRIR